MAAQSKMITVPINMDILAHTKLVGWSSSVTTICFAVCALSEFVQALIYDCKGVTDIM